MSEKPIPEVTALNQELPEHHEIIKEVPKETQPVPDKPTNTEPEKELPPDKPLENCVQVGDRLIEIKPTKLKYFRNRTASIYSILKMIPLGEFLAYEEGTFDKNRDSDQILFDFLVAVFDDVDLVRTYYDDMTAEDVDKILKIFGRLNHIDEKEEEAKKKQEEARKNKEAQAKR